ncbi:hypothetical protein B0H11DRAFT_2191308 [Mycena galericulata]|nr:hypothetical protein B0H11DRAFT_2191308 [Mycena galericulata]
MWCVALRYGYKDLDFAEVLIELDRHTVHPVAEICPAFKLDLSAVFLRPRCALPRLFICSRVLSLVTRFYVSNGARILSLQPRCAPRSFSRGQCYYEEGHFFDIRYPEVCTWFIHLRLNSGYYPGWCRHQVRGFVFLPSDFRHHLD